MQGIMPLSPKRLILLRPVNLEYHATSRSTGTSGLIMEALFITLYKPLNLPGIPAFATLSTSLLRMASACSNGKVWWWDPEHALDIQVPYAMQQKPVGHAMFQAQTRC